MISSRFVVKSTLLLAGALLAAVLPPLPRAFGEPVECEAPDELMHIDDQLPRLAERLHANEPVKIVAIGGASTTGLAAGSSELAYPHRLQEILIRWYPSFLIPVVNRGGPRPT